MKIPYKNIYDVLHTNRFIVMATIFGSVITCCFSTYMVLKLHNNSMDSAFVINSDGSIIPLKMVSQRENLEVESKTHLTLFHQYFYGIDASNYEKNLEKALWLGNSSIDALYHQKKVDGVYNRLLQYALVQKVISIESIVDIQEEPFPFTTRTVFNINRGPITDIYELTTSGNLMRVDRNFPHNPHGLLITNFFENTLRKLDNYAPTKK